MILRIVLAFAFSAQATETSLISSGKFREANQALERMELSFFVSPGISPLSTFIKIFPADRVYLERNLTNEVVRLRAFERLGEARFQVTLPDGRSVAITPGRAPKSVQINGKLVRLNNAPEFFGDVQGALERKVAAWGFLWPDRAFALAVLPMVLGAAVVGAYAWWQERKENKKPTTEAYLAKLVSACRQERDEQGTPFAASRTAAQFRAAIDNKVVSISTQKVDCKAYVKAMVVSVAAEQLRAGDPARTCEQLESYKDCLEVYKLRGGGNDGAGRLDKASDSAR